MRWTSRPGQCYRGRPPTTSQVRRGISPRARCARYACYEKSSWMLAFRACFAGRQSGRGSWRCNHQRVGCGWGTNPQHNIDLSHVPTNHSPARQAKRVFLVTAIRPHGVCSQTLMLAGLNGELILFEFMLGFILHPNLRADSKQEMPSDTALQVHSRSVELPLLTGYYRSSRVPSTPNV